MSGRAGFLAVATAAVLATGAAAAAAAPTAVLQPVSPAASSAAPLAATPATSTVEMQIGLKPASPVSAAAFVQAVSTPGSPLYRHFLTPAQWRTRFGPSAAAVAAVTGWLRSQGATVEGVSADRLTVEASAPAATVETIFGTGLRQYRLHGREVRLATSPLLVPASIAPLISGVMGVNQTLARPAGVTGAATPRVRRAAAEEPIPQPEGFRNAPPCSTYYGEKPATEDPAYGAFGTLPFAVCGYTPPQLQSAYSLTNQIAAGIDGTGVTVAVVDAYVSPTLLADAQTYAAHNQPAQPLASSQFSELLPKSYNNIATCEASGWFGEQTLDVEAVHATAPGAHILYVGARNCEGALFTAVQKIVDGHLAQVVTDSWGDNGGDLLDPAGVREAFDNVLMEAAGTGVSVLFSSGDEGDNFHNLGITAPDYPPSSPYATAVGGTSLQVGAAGARIGETGWSTSKSALCTETLVALEACSTASLNSWVPPAPGAYDYGGGGGTSFQYREPWYQAAVVPAPLAERNSAITKTLNRVEPDISVDGDPSTGMLVGETQTFPDGVYYDQYRLGGTSLSSPLLAGMLADAAQRAGTPLGFINPLVYKLSAEPAPKTPGAGPFYDVLQAHRQAVVRNDYLDGVDAKEGVITSARGLGYEGREEYCSGTGNCAHQKVALNATKGYDSMTGTGSPGALLVPLLAGR